MIQKYFTVSCFLLSLVLCFSCGSSKHAGKSADTLLGTWQSQPILVDGDSKDWPSPYPNYDSKAMVAYATSNDKKNLYITMQTGDEMTQIKILRQGMTVLIDTSGKKEAQFKINYPLVNDNEPLDIARQGRGQSMLHPEEMWRPQIAKSAKDANQYTLEGFRNCNGGYLVSQTTTCGIKVILKIDEFKELVWEAIVPFKAIYNKDTISESEAGKPISVCFAINRFKHPETKAENNSGMNNSMNANSMQPGTARIPSHSGGRNVSADPMQHLYENTKTWKQFGLAYQR